MKAVVAAFNQEKALEGAFSVITNLRMDLFEALVQATKMTVTGTNCRQPECGAVVLPVVGVTIATSGLFCVGFILVLLQNNTQLSHWSWRYNPTYQKSVDRRLSFTHV